MPRISPQCRKLNGNALTNHKYPRIISRRHFERLLGLMEGVTVKSGGRSTPSAPKIESTVLADVKPDSPVMRKEIRCFLCCPIAP